MQYILLIYNNESEMPAPPTDPAAMAEYMKPWDDYTAELQKAGVMLGANALQPTATATTVSASAGKPVLTDGPFAETKEQLGGYYLVDCPDLDSALKWAAKCPAVHTGRVEVRPVANFERS
jgi:hypothetical protein